MARRRPEIWIVRHGETEWSRTRRHTGRTDVPLTSHGEREATLLRPRLHRRRFALVLSSPLRRAWDTCVLAGYGGVAQKAEDLLEWDYGAYEGRTSREIQAEVAGWSIWTGGVPAGEAADDVARRAERAIERALAAGGDVALFAHGHVLRVLAARWLGLPPREGRLFALGTASTGVLGFEDDARVMRTWNLPPDGA